MTAPWDYSFDWTFLGVVLTVVSIWLALIVKNIGRREGRLPPGPPTRPIVGNLHLLPKKSLHIKFTEWSKVYGDIYSLKFGPATAVVLTSPRLIKELMDKRSASSADRAPNYLVDLTVGGMNMALARYGKQWRTSRRAAHELLTRNACMKHLPVQEAEATQLMYELLTRPDTFYTDIKRYSASVMTSLLWGRRCPSSESALLTEFNHALDMWKKVTEPGAHPPLDLLPILKYVPERWAPWKALVREVRYLQRKLYSGLIDQCETRVLEGKRNGSFIEGVLNNPGRFGITRELTGYLAGTLLDGGSETAALFLHSLVLALVAFPEVQKKAQEEIDRVVGSERVPILDDLKDLPYVQAIVKETHRFRPVAPLGLPHALLVDEEIDGYILPKGTSIFMNTWGLFHDEEAYDKPEIFNPDRFLTTEYGTKPYADDCGRRHDFAFGCGRRICPGIHLAQNSISLNAMNLLWGFRFSEAIDPSTNMPIKVDINDYVESLIMGPSPFQCKIEVRSADHAQLIRREFVRAKTTFLPFELEPPRSM